MKNNFPFLVMVVSTCLLQLAACKKESAEIPNMPDAPDDPVNETKPPIAHAGDDTTIYLPSTTCELDGAASTDPDSNIVSYAWRRIAGPSPVDITHYDKIKAMASGLENVGKYVFELTVTDADRLSSKDTMTVTVAGPSCMGTSQEVVFKDLSWSYAWLMEIDIYDFFTFLPPNSYIKSIYIKRDASSNWEKVVPVDSNSSDYGKVPEWEYGNGVLVIYPGSNRTDDTPDVKIEYCN